MMTDRFAVLALMDEHNAWISKENYSFSEKLDIETSALIIWSFNLLYFLQ